MEKGVVYDNEYDYALCDANFQIKNKSSDFKFGADQNWELCQAQDVGKNLNFNSSRLNF